MSCYVLYCLFSSRAMPCRAISRHLISCVTSYRVIPRPVMSCSVMSCHDMICHDAVVSRDRSSLVMSPFVVSLVSYFMYPFSLCHVRSCNDLPCQVLLCRICCRVGSYVLTLTCHRRWLPSCFYCICSPCMVLLLLEPGPTRPSRGHVESLRGAQRWCRGAPRRGKHHFSFKDQRFGSI